MLVKRSDAKGPYVQLPELVLLREPGAQYKAPVVYRLRGVHYCAFSWLEVYSIKQLVVCQLPVVMERAQHWTVQKLAVCFDLEDLACVCC